MYKESGSVKEKLHHQRNALLTSLKFMGFNDSYEILNDDQQLAKTHFKYQQYISRHKAMVFSHIDAFWTDNETLLKLNKFNTIDTN